MPRCTATNQSTGPDLNETTTAPAEPTDHVPLEAVPIGAVPEGDPISLEAPRTTFAELGLSDAVLRAIADMGYRHPTPIQEQAIPTILMTAYPDVRAQAQAIKANVLCYLVKPFAADDLLACVRYAVQSRDPNGS